MEMLEAALKHSLEWSMSNRQQQQATVVRHELDATIEQDSHVRAVVTRFKIELNHLMGIKWMLATNDTSLSDDTNTTASSGDDDSRSSSKVGATMRDRQKPAIKLNGKYSGVYEIGDEADDEVDSELSAAMAKCSISRQNPVIHEIDDGYRSLSRGSGGAALQAREQTSASARASANLVKQLNDIKSRVVDLVDEIEQCTANARLDEDEIEAYRRRRDALLQRLDLLIESQKHIEVSKGEQSTRQRATSSSLNESYEEQVQVIDYDFSRRASDLIEMKSQQSSIDCSPLVDSSSMTRVNVCTSNTQIVHPIRATKIDFGAMMRNYETRKREDEVTTKSTIIHNHLPSSSSTSTDSNNSCSSASTNTNSSSTSSFI